MKKLLPVTLAALCCFTIGAAGIASTMSLKVANNEKQVTKNVPTPPPTPKSTTHFAFNFLSLLPLSPNRESKSPVIAAMIENHEDARPHQRGLAEADVVFELIVEGDITRFMAFFHEKKLPEFIGPIRSLRPHFISLAEIYSALVLHAGASTIAYDNLEHGTNIINHDGIHYDGDTYERDRGIDPPHNLFMPKEALQALIAQKRSRLPAFTFPLFEGSGSIPEGGQPAKEIHINFGSKTHNVQLTYNAWKKRYNRATGGTEHQAMPSSVLVLEAHIDGYGRPGYIPWTKTFGDGKMLLFRNGKKFEGRWKREKGQSFEFADEDGNVLPLTKGQVWVTMVPRLSMVSWEE